MRIDRLTDFSDPRWDGYVEHATAATCCHLAAWSGIGSALYGWEPYYLYAEVNERIVGILPMVHVRSRWGAGALVSTPFCVYGGVVADNDDIRRALEDRASVLARDLDVGHVELRQAGTPNPNWQSHDLYATFQRALSANAEENLQAIPRKQRAMVRKGIKHGLEVRADMAVDEFYPLFCASMRSLGTPVYPRALFDEIMTAFGPRAEILGVEHNGRIIAAVLSLYFKDIVLPYYAGATAAARDVAAYDFMYWSLMSRAVDKGVRQFDFGRSMRGSGAFAFKKNWGFEPQVLNYQYDLVHTKKLPIKDPNKPLYRVLVAAWQNLPQALADRLGPLIARALY